MTPQLAHHIGFDLARSGQPARIPLEHLEAITSRDDCLFHFFEGHAQGAATRSQQQEARAA